MRIVQDNEASDLPEYSPIEAALVDLRMDLRRCPPPRSLAIDVAIMTLELALRRGVTPRLEIGLMVVVGEKADPEHAPIRRSHEVIEVECERGSKTQGAAEDLLKAAEAATHSDPRWIELYREIMRPLCVID